MVQDGSEDQCDPQRFCCKGCDAKRAQARPRGYSQRKRSSRSRVVGLVAVAGCGVPSVAGFTWTPLRPAQYTHHHHTCVVRNQLVYRTPGPLNGTSSSSLSVPEGNTRAVTPWTLVAWPKRKAAAAKPPLQSVAAVAGPPIPIASPVTWEDSQAAVLAGDAPRAVAGDAPRAVAGDAPRAVAGDAPRAAAAASSAVVEPEGGGLGGWATAVVRTFRIWWFLFSVMIKLGRLKMLGKDEAALSAGRRKLGKFLCQGFLKLGPTFIKVGQLMSTRIDILSKEYIEELRLLQDSVPGFGGKAAVEIVERELGAPVGQLFDSFNTTSLAAASVGQVHEAYLNGERYAVKVQRPGLQQIFAIDLKSLAALAAILDRFDPKADGTAKDWTSIFRESRRVLYEEVDYCREGRNAERFAYNFRNCPWIKAPAIRWDRSTDKVLCMEFVEGIKISQVDEIRRAGIDSRVLAKRAAECYMAQLCRHGFFHCDPHPGNLAVDGVEGGRIIFYDFGMMDELPLSLKRGLVNLIFGIYENDVKEVCDSLEGMDIIRKGADRMTLERVARFYLGEFSGTLKSGGKYINQMSPEEERVFRRRERARIGQELFSVKSDIPLQFPASFTFVFRAFTTLDGIGKTLDPQYDLSRIAQPYLKELLDLKDGSVFASVLKAYAKKVGWRGRDIASLVQSARRVEHINEVATRLEQGDLKLRVRAVEAEQAFKRIEARQASMETGLMSMLFLNTGLLLTTTASTVTVGARLMFLVAAAFGVQIPVGYLKAWRLQRLQEGAGGFR